MYFIFSQLSKQATMFKLLLLCLLAHSEFGELKPSPRPELMTLPPKTTKKTPMDTFIEGLPSFLDPRYTKTRYTTSPPYTLPPGFIPNNEGVMTLPSPTPPTTIPTTSPPITSPTSTNPTPGNQQEVHLVTPSLLLYFLLISNLIMMTKLSFLLWRIRQLRKLSGLINMNSPLPLSQMEEETL